MLKHKNIDTESGGIGMVNVKDLVSDAEKKANTANKGKHNRRKPTKCNLFQKFVQSRFIGIVVGPLYGVFIYYYVTYLILSGPPFMMEREVNSTDGVVGNIVGDAIEDQGVQVSETIGANTPHANDTDLVDRTLAQYIGGSIGGGTAVLLAVGSAVSAKTRCAMMLIIPSLAARRGRAFLLTTAAGMLLTGPVATIDHNIQQVVTSLTCMYEQMKSLADLYLEQFEEIWDRITDILSRTNEIIDVYKKKLAELAEDATEDVRRQIEHTQEEVRRQAEKLDKALSGLEDILDAPGNAAGWICSQGESVLAFGKKAGNAIGKTAKKGWKKVKNIFGRRRKRNACGIPPVVPDVDINVPDVSLHALKDFLKTLKPDVDLIDFDYEGILGELQHNNIYEIRERLKSILKSIFELVKNYSGYITKIFYLSIILVVVDAMRYMKLYYSDDAFDNMMVDDNLRQLWKAGDKVKILPLRKWELKIRYQYSKSYKVSKAEVKRIIIGMIPTLLFIIIAGLLMAGDYGLSALLTLFREEAQFGISFDGSEQGVNFNSLLGGLQSGTVDVASINLQGFNLSTEPCLPQPQYTELNYLIGLSLLMVTALLLSISNAYGSRTRAMICNMYFTQRAKERAEYLYKRIQTGRRTRRIQLSMIITQELDRRERAHGFYCPCFTSDCCRHFQTKIEERQCPACNCKMKKIDEAPFHVTRHSVKEEIAICKDCHKDVE